MANQLEMGLQSKKSTCHCHGILIPSDFSEVCEVAFVYGLKLASQFQCGICLLHVITVSDGSGLTENNPVFRDCHHKLSQCQEKFGKNYNVPINLHIREGNLFKVVNTVVSEIRPRLMVMGTHGKQGLQHLFGSYALKVILDSPCTVMVVQDRPYENEFRHILIPLNFEFDPIPLIEWLMLFYKVSSPQIHLFRPAGSTPEGEKRISGVISQITGSLNESKVPFFIDTAASPDDFPSQVVSFASEVKSDLIITMTAPAMEVTGYSFTDWNERLMFNQDKIPVMFINQADCFC